VIRPGNKIPVDGEVLEGESMPVGENRGLRLGSFGNRAHPAAAVILLEAEP